MNYVFHPAAEAEHLESVAYFESKMPGLGASYLLEFEKILGQVCESPQRYPIAKKVLPGFVWVHVKLPIVEQDYNPNPNKPESKHSPPLQGGAMGRYLCPSLY